MSVEIVPDPHNNILFVQAHDTLSKDDYERLVPVVERAIKQHGKIRVLFNMEGFHGWTAGAIWEDMKFDVAHFKDIERVALVGDALWEKWMAAICKPFTAAQVRFFNWPHIDAAESWLRDGSRDGHHS